MRFDDPTIESLLLSTDPKRLVVFAELEFPGGWVRAHTGVGERTYQGQVYLGVGELAQIGAFKESAGNSPNGFEVSMVFDDMTLFADIVNEDPTGLVARLHLVALDENRRVKGGALLFDGYNGGLSVKKGKPFTASLRLTDWYERWSQPVQNARISDEAQQHIHPGDRIYNQIEKLAKGIESDAPGSYVGGGGAGSGGGRQNRRRQQHL
ncbi:MULTISPECIES: hypothetical protein [Idiomarina]|uniref:hypothetical protein n=1 Tax=Idiomarina TaxID=135575 RepID=UPI00129B6999|nr:MULTISPECIES: hypothetical protein [Idiomarina]MRJ41199.1 hypothetical protein [Idiomarina sp. FeN1]NCU56364.1 hypothetical protein [Idiomarina sp. FenA--70]NCU59383.1 hypothetical protein [Idiomarina sp. FenBw--71]UUN12558.1 hypothetical protein KGF88_07770 [Idiomarina loihiensis]